MVIPFRALRFDDPHSTESGVLELDSVIAPSNVFDNAEQRAVFAARNDFNIAAAIDDAGAFDRWTKTGWLSRDEEPAMYLYRIGFTDHEGRPQQWNGVFAQTGGRAELTSPQIAPHRISVGAEGFSDLLTPVGLMPLARATDDHGAHHRIWAITQAGVLDLLADAIERHGEPAPSRLTPGTLILAGEATQPEYAPALGLIVG